MNSSSRLPFLIAGTLISAAAWYFAIDLNGAFGWLLWIAPLPLLMIAFQASARQTFLCSFIAYFIGRLSWLSFFLTVLPPVMTAILTVLLPLTFSLLILLTRWIVVRNKNFMSVFAYPAVMTAGEFISLGGSADGTAGSLAYSQANYLSIIQIASLTGIWGILFLALLIPSTLAVAWTLRENKIQSRLALLVGCIVFILASAFGWVRMNQHPDHQTIPIGLTVIPEKLHGFDHPSFIEKKKVVQYYIDQIIPLAKAGATYVIFPEKVLRLKSTEKDSVLGMLQHAAADNKVTIIGGFLAFKEDDSKQNLEEFISPDGKIQEYIKRFHVRGFEDGEEVGEKVGQLQGMPIASAMAICKDMDFPQWLRQYSDASLLFVPAWDFEKDGWQHSRMAVLRGIENGYTIVRAARQGRLTVSDFCGRILAEENCDHGNAGSLLAQVPVYKIRTLYSQWGDWFGWTCSAMVCGFVVAAVFRPKKL